VSTSFKNCWGITNVKSIECYAHVSNQTIQRYQSTLDSLYYLKNAHKSCVYILGSGKQRKENNIIKYNNNG